MICIYGVVGALQIHVMMVMIPDLTWMMVMIPDLTWIPHDLISTICICMFCSVMQLHGMVCLQCNNCVIHT